MSQSIGITITYNTPLSRESARGVLDALAEAVEANWREEHRDEWSDPAPPFPVEPERWMAQLEERGMQEVSVRLEPAEVAPAAPERQTWVGPGFSFSFSPLSLGSAYGSLRRTEGNALRIGVHINERCLFEGRGDREVYRMKQAVPRERRDDAWYERFDALEELDDIGEQNKQFLFAIAKCLVDVHPVWRIEVDPLLLPRQLSLGSRN